MTYLKFSPNIHVHLWLETKYLQTIASSAFHRHVMSAIRICLQAQLCPFLELFKVDNLTFTPTWRRVCPNVHFTFSAFHQQLSVNVLQEEMLKKMCQIENTILRAQISPVCVLSTRQNISIITSELMYSKTHFSFYLNTSIVAFELLFKGEM